MKIFTSKKIAIFILFIFILSLLIYKFFWVNDQKVSNYVNSINQNALAYVKKDFVVDHKTQSKLVRDYLKSYFSPWDIKTVQESIDHVREIEKGLAVQYTKHPGWGEGSKPNSETWINKIILNMNLARIPNLNMRAIVIGDVNVRVLPTVDPAFADWHKAGEGYPFDYLQATHVYVNTPVAVLHVSRDGQWYLIKAAGYIGWLPTDKVAFVDYSFIKKWRAYDYVVATYNHHSAFDDTLTVRLKTHIGILYPLVGITKSYYKILIATSGDKYAKTRIVNLRKIIATKFPMKITTKNIATIANRMLGKPYDWGSMYGHDDCSGLTMDLFANFAIWLPRNSTDQIAAGQPISLANLTNKQKEKLIVDKAIPFMTLVHEPGHILVYLGRVRGKIYVLHNPWGLETINLFGKTGRAVIGKAVITPLRLGEGYINVPASYLDKVDAIRVLIK
jgi:hypothetical protein